MGVIYREELMAELNSKFSLILYVKVKLNIFLEIVSKSKCWLLVLGGSWA